MKFGVYSSIAVPPAGENIARCIEEVLEEAQLAEECGFDSYFFGEHHQDKDGFLPSPLIVATAVAVRTRTLQVGTSVILLPLHHPVHLAEDVVTLDQVSQGRIILGVGIGYQPADFRAFDIAMENRVGLFEEGIEVIRQCWTGKPFTFRGEHFSIQDVTVRPAPYQQPSPPLWIGASTMPGARRAGRLADAFIAGPSTNLERTLRLVDAYRESALKAGREPNVVLMRDAWVAETRAQAEETYGPEVLDALQVLLAQRAGRIQEVHVGAGIQHRKHRSRPPDPGRPRGMCGRVPPLERSGRHRLLPPETEACPLRGPASRENHGRHKALRPRSLSDVPLRLAAFRANGDPEKRRVNNTRQFIPADLVPWVLLHNSTNLEADNGVV